MVVMRELMIDGATLSQAKNEQWFPKAENELLIFHINYFKDYCSLERFVSPPKKFYLRVNWHVSYASPRRDKIMGSL